MAFVNCPHQSSIALHILNIRVSAPFENCSCDIDATSRTNHMECGMLVLNVLMIYIKVIMQQNLGSKLVGGEALVIAIVLDSPKGDFCSYNFELRPLLWVIVETLFNQMVKNTFIISFILFVSLSVLLAKYVFSCHNLLRTTPEGGDV
jgi:hypothetical protein